MKAPTRCCRAVVDPVGAELMLTLLAAPGEPVAVLGVAPTEAVALASDLLLAARAGMGRGVEDGRALDAAWTVQP